MKWRDNQELLKENPGGSIQATCGCLIKAAETWVNQANAAVPSRQSIRNISDHGQTEKLRMSTPLETREKRDGDNEKTKTNRSKLTYLHSPFWSLFRLLRQRGQNDCDFDSDVGQSQSQSQVKSNYKLQTTAHRLSLNPLAAGWAACDPLPSRTGPVHLWVKPSANWG